MLPTVLLRGFPAIVALSLSVRSLEAELCKADCDNVLQNSTQIKDKHFGHIDFGLYSVVMM